MSEIIQFLNDLNALFDCGASMMKGFKDCLTPLIAQIKADSARMYS